MTLLLRDPEPYRTWIEAMVDTREPEGDVVLTHNMGPCNGPTDPCTTYDQRIHLVEGDSPERRRSFYHELGHVHHMRYGPPPMPDNCRPEWDNPEGWAQAFQRCAYGDRKKEVGAGINDGMPVWTQVGYDRVAEFFRTCELLAT